MIILFIFSFHFIILRQVRNMGIVKSGLFVDGRVLGKPMYGYM